MDDRAIVEKFLARDEDAVREAQQRYGAYCLSVADNVLGNRQDAEECLSDALLAAWNSIPPHEPENLRTYLGKLVRETAINRRKRNARQKRIRAEDTCPLDELEELVADGSVGDAVEEEELSRAISRFLWSVGETKRNVFIRRYWYCDSVPSICARYGFGKSKVLMMLKRTRDDLAAYLKKEGFLT